MKKCILLIVVVSLAFGSTAFGQFSKKGTSGAQFLKIGVGARAISMGQAFVAIANDASALYWNPAGTARLYQNEAVFSYTDWLADISHNYVGFVYAMGAQGSIGISVTALSMGRMEVTTVDEPDGTGNTFGASSYAAGITYARNLTDRFSIGMKFKYIRESIWDMGASGVAFDLGTIYNIGFEGLKLGMSMSNFGGEMRFEGGSLLTAYDAYPEEGNVAPVDAFVKTMAYPLPMTFRLGLAYTFIENEKMTLHSGLDFVKVNDREEGANFGAEYIWNNMISVRAGYQFNADDDYEYGLAFGGGFAYSIGNVTARIDYAYADMGRLSSINRFTFHLLF